MPSTTETNLAYLAGVIDGEGTLGVYKRKLKGRIEYIAVCTVANTNIALIEWLVSKFGGGVTISHRTSPCRNVYKWRISDRRVLAELLPSVIPYLILKKEQAQLVLSLPYGGGGRKYIPHEQREHLRVTRETLAARSKALNSRGC